jgi:two-component system, repressor protein LuxO
MKTNPQSIVLLVEDDVMTAVTYKAFLTEEPISLTHLETGDATLTYLKKMVPDVILLDLGLPDMNGMEILKYIHQQQLQCTVIIITMEHSVDVVVKAMRYGAFDFIEKPCQANRLLVTLRNGLHQHHLSQKVAFYEANLKRQQYHKYHDLIGASKPMQTVYQIIENVATSKASILITGESGTGKELCARAIHQESQRKDKPFIALNCAAIPKDLMESEIFGHLKGAFTGAVNNKLGAVHQADGGTLFLDEIGEMEISLQSKLLRFAQSSTFYPVGGQKEEQVDVRFISATNRDLLAEVKAKQFREDLYYRLNGIQIQLPSLRQRGQDILLLARIILKQYAQEEKKSFNAFTKEVEEIFLSYEWPGNIRQLQNVLYHIVVLNEGETITADMLPSPLGKVAIVPIDTTVNPPQPQISTPRPKPIADKPPKKKIRPLWQLEQVAIEEAIEECNGNVQKAADLLEISKSKIYQKLHEWNINFKRTIKSS